jgi:hypothetical protein
MSFIAPHISLVHSDAAASIEAVKIGDEHIACRGCGHKVEPDVAELVERYGADTPVSDWAARLRCSKCGPPRGRFRRSGFGLSGSL